MTVSPSSRCRMEYDFSNCQPGHRRGDRQTGTELVGLEDRAVGQIAPGQAGGKAEIVLDPHTAARLSAGSAAFQHHRP